MVQYYTLDEAAQILRMTPEKLKEMVRTNKVRAFQDRGTLRFRAQEIDEMARTMGLSSDAELPLGEAPPPSPSKSPSPSKPPSSSKQRKSKMQPKIDDEEVKVTDFTLSSDDESVPLGSNPASGAVHSTPHTTAGKRKTTPPRPSQLGKQPAPRAEDSDVRLIGQDGAELDFNLTVDDASSKSGRGKSKVSKEADSDVKLERPADEIDLGKRGPKRPSDSDIRLESDDALPMAHHDPLVTEEIDLDLEAMKAEQDANKPRQRPGTSGSDQHPALPTSSPFELSDSDIEVEVKPKKTGSKSGKKSKVAPPPPPPAEKDSSDEFELTAFDEKSSPLESSSDAQIPLIEEDEEVSLGELTGGAGASGINLSPADSGISLEQGGSDEIEFELTLDAGASPTPSKKKLADSQNSEFELSLQEGEGGESGVESSSEFELTLDEDSSSSVVESESDLEIQPESDSEFELTLDEGGGLTPLEETAALAEEGEEAVEETDFDVPALEEDSEEMALEESSSDFDLSVDESSVEEDESGSQAVVLEDEEEAESEIDTDLDAEVEAEAEADEDVKPTKPRGRRAAGGDDGLELDLDLDTEGEVEAEEEEEGAVVGAAAAPPAEWGILPTLLMAPCVIVLFLVGLMGYEMIQGMWGYHKGAKVSRLIIDPMARMFDENLPKD
jgi:hypothetical protein